MGKLFLGRLFTRRYSSAFVLMLLGTLALEPLIGGWFLVVAIFGGWGVSLLEDKFGDA